MPCPMPHVKLRWLAAAGNLVHREQAIATYYHNYLFVAVLIYIEVNCRLSVVNKGGQGLVGGG